MLYILFAAAFTMPLKSDGDLDLPAPFFSFNITSSFNIGHRLVFGATAISPVVGRVTEGKGLKRDLTGR